MRGLAGEFDHFGRLAFVEFAGVALAGDDVDDFDWEEHVFGRVADDEDGEFGVLKFALVLHFEVLADGVLFVVDFEAGFVGGVFLSVGGGRKGMNVNEKIEHLVMKKKHPKTHPPTWQP